MEKASPTLLEKAQEAGIIVKRENNFEGFWKVLDANLEERYQVHPVHTLQEIELLHSRFQITSFNTMPTWKMRL